MGRFYTAEAVLMVYDVQIRRESIESPPFRILPTCFDRLICEEKDAFSPG